MLQAFFKRNGLLFATAAVWLGATLGAIGLIDVSVYQARKRDIIFDYSTQIFPRDLVNELDRLARDWRDAIAAGRVDDATTRPLAERASAIINGPTSIYRIEVRPHEGPAFFDESTDKFARFNHFNNSLWLKRFSRRVGQEFLDTSTGQSIGWYTYHFTTPDTLPPPALGEIEALTSSFRLLTLGIAALFTLVTALFVLRVLIPMRNVIDRIETSSPEAIRFVRRPRTQLELLYNRMALEAVFARLEERLGRAIESGGAVSASDLIDEAARYFVSQRSSAALACIDLAEDGEGRPRPSGRPRFYRGSEVAAIDDEAGAAAQLGDALGRLPKPAREGARAPGADPPDAVVMISPFTAARLLANPERAGAWCGLALTQGAAEAGSTQEEASNLLRGFSAVAARGVATLVSRQRALERERGRASMNLSRNLGHDLTNIIATSKLDLMTLEAILGNGAHPLDDSRRAILGESLRGLLDSTRFLQEVVNLYRAYAFLRRPVFELRDANELVRETVALFTLSTSNRIKFEERLNPAAPRCLVDPRLVKLALFNLFSNALDAIRRAGHGEDALGRIDLVTSAGPRGGLRVEIRDNGSGIRNEAGGLASEGEIEKIFSLGYSVGRDSEGEGLGLNWVRTIVAEIHGGAIRAENAPEGGARFILDFPPPEAFARDSAAEPAAQGDA